MYNTCGAWVRETFRPADKIMCAQNDQVVFEPEKTLMSSLPLDSWACWNGRLGRGGGLPAYSTAPYAPLRQQTFTLEKWPCRRVLH
jgi:hypothetical protein